MIGLTDFLLVITCIEVYTLAMLLMIEDAKVPLTIKKLKDYQETFK